MTGFRAGAGRAEIRYPDDVWPLDGFSGTHDPLFVRVVVLDGTQQLVWAVLDQTSLAPEPLARVRDVIAEIAGVADRQVVVSVTHTFSAPHLADPATLDDPGLAERMRVARLAVFAAVADATHDAVRTLRPATLGVGCGGSDVNVNRDVETSAGWTLGLSADGYSDPTLVVVRLDDADARPIAVLVNHAVQPSATNVPGDAARPASADLAGVAVRRIEAETGAVACFLIGAAGDQAPNPAAAGVGLTDSAPDEGGFLLAERLGDRLGEAALAAWRATASAPCAPDLRVHEGLVRVGGQRATPRQDIRPTRVHAYRPEPPRDLPYWVLGLGEVAVVGVQVELSAATGRRLREGSPFPHTVVATMVNGAAKYLPDAGAFDRFTYEAQSSHYARGAAEALTRRIGVHLHELHAAARPDPHQGDST
ncbi:MAG: hypothetical protein QM779_01735 [Propionicimonas sp.]|uniref:hypothetical protein n=1 Tax=Propionicimonas sp. TaxID=1955623 RepID=UPI003D0A6F0B